MGILNDIGGWLSSNSDWLKPTLSLGSNLYKYNQSSGNQANYISMLKQQEDRKFADTQAYNDAARAYNEQVASAQNANAAAAARASAINQANAQAAKNKAAKQMDKVYKRNLEIYKPFKNTALDLLPQMSKAYSDSLTGYNMLAAYLQRPEQMAKLDLNRPQWAVGAPTPSWAKGG